MQVYFRTKFIIPYSCLALALVLLVLTHRVDSEPTHDKQALLSFLSSHNTNRVQWNASTSACNWVGVECNANRSSVISLRLPSVGLVGPIPANTIGKLTHLRVLSLRSNRLSGLIPSDFSNLKQLRSLYLNANLFSGEFPNNEFTGNLPIITGERLMNLNVSNNHLEGSIPGTLSSFPASTFAGNIGLCGRPLPPCGA
ncbi:hypothetical protein Vadar_031926 [Vaccinium darrowii]|uniref:Uncharacterized protein n=1 Tax=Vaccinium darrowii TaxID=229202 RepID=A0ACB7YRH4_9ERIC|nr:hypothetical protein Vadar_031926 [Vaccinium darrowii]